MSGQEDTARGGSGRGIFLSAHRCPEVDMLLPHQTAGAQILPLCSLVPAEKKCEFTCIGESEADDLDFCSTHRSEADEEVEDEGSVSDWSEEDLSLHFSPSVLVQSDDETSDPESGFECVDITVETQVKGQDVEGLKMVPKRQIHLKKKKDGEDSVEQVILKDVPAEGRGIINDTSANELLCPTTRPRPELLLRQHSMPTSFNATSNASCDSESYRVYKGPIAGAGQGLLIGGNSQRLQKSFSLDETKTKMASCLIKNVLSKKMQVEQNNLKKNPKVSPVLPLPLEHQTGGGGARVPVHVVRDVRSLVKHTYGRSFATSSASRDNKSTSCTAIGQEDSPPPTYQQGVKGHISKVAVSFSQSQDKNPNKSFRQSMTQQRRGSEPIISRGLDHLDPPTLKPNPSARAVTPPSHQGTQPLLGAQDQSSILGVSSLSAPGSSQHLLQTPFPSSLHQHLRKVDYVHTPLSYIQTQQSTPGPSIHLPSRSEEFQNPQTANFSEQVDPTKTQRDREGQSRTAIPPSQNQPELQQQHLRPQAFLCSVPSLLPAQVSGDFLVHVLGSAAAPGTFFRVPAPCQLMLDPKSGRFFYADTSLQHQRKMLLDPETGQFFQVFLPLAGSISNAAMFPVACANPAPTMIQVGTTKPMLFSVMPFQQAVGVSSFYGLPVTVMASNQQNSDDITHILSGCH